MAVWQYVYYGCKWLPFQWEVYFEELAVTLHTRNKWDSGNAFEAVQCANKHQSLG